MIIRKVCPAPFGALKNRQFTFEKGLNVLLGPNEAGKSTLINAIFAALFIPSNVKKSSDDWKRMVQKFLPYPDGDTARVEVEFEDESAGVLLYSTSWGGSKNARLVTAGGSEINDPEEARVWLQNSLRYGRGTYQTILFARQEEMNRTFERLNENAEAKASLSDLLRSALFEAGGVSLEKLEKLLAEEYKRLLQNWDLDLAGPRGGRDINNPHKKQVGEVLKAYYQKEQLRRKLKEVQTLEEQVKALNDRLSGANKKNEQVTMQLREMEKLENDMRQRSQLKPDLDSTVDKEKSLKKIMAEWPRVEERVQGLGKELVSREKRIEQLQEELREAKEVLNSRELRELLQRAGPLVEEIKRQEQNLLQMPHLAEDDLHYLESKKEEHERQKAVAEAMKLKASVHAKKPLELTVTSGIEDTRKVVVEDEELIEGEGRLLLESADWKINIQSGEQDVEKLIKQAEEAKQDYRAKLDQFALNELEQVRSLVNKRKELKSALDKNRFKLQEMLAGLSFEELEQKVSALSPEKSVRDPEQITADLEENKVSLQTLKYELAQEEKRLKEWQEEYKSVDDVMEETVALRQKVKDLEEKLNKLAPLPREYDSIEQFFAHLKELRSENEATKQQIESLKTELITIKGKMPDESTEEVEEALVEAENKFNRLNKKGRAVNLIWEEFQALKEELDARTYDPLAESFARYLSSCTGNNYNLAELDGPVPDRIVAANNQQEALPVHLLSAGTTSGAALALRLAMAEYLLQGLDGFLVMDDPLVNLDPERRRSAAGAIRQFAEKKQMIVATCDPDTAALLDGHIIKI